jgi:photosystem II stability/assembly factor-like uncharacterized protein
LLTVGVSGFVLVLLFSVTGHASGDRSSIGVEWSDMPLHVLTPTIQAVHPRQAPNNLDTTIIITGTDFHLQATGEESFVEPEVYLNDFPLPAVGWVSSTTLTATVSWGLDPGIYTLTVANPEGARGVLKNAFTVAQGIGVWTTGGPYGGQIKDLAVSPVTSRTAYAVAGGAGLYRTTDGGDWWEPVISDGAGHGGVAYGPPPTHTLYYWGAGLHRSDDAGETWHRLFEEHCHAFAYAPQDARRLWSGRGSGVFLSEDGGVTWSKRDTGLPVDVWPTQLAVHPTNADIVYAGTSDGRLYLTEDNGMHWYPISTDDPSTDHPVQALAIHPLYPKVLLFSRMHQYDVSHYRSTDGGISWTPLQAAPELGAAFISDLAFSRQVSGTVYGTMMGHPLIRSEDGGLTWTAVCTDVNDGVYSLGLDPTEERPVYLGGWSGGTHRSHDGGRTFEPATEGIAALWVLDVATSEAHPQTVYTAVDSDAFKSEDGGARWQRLPLEQAFSVAVDPQDHRRAYVGWAGIYRTVDGGATWSSPEVPTEGLSIQEITVNPLSPHVVFAGGHATGRNASQIDRRTGILLRSDDYGQTWAQLDVGRPISTIGAVVVDPIDHQTVYMTIDAGGRGGEWSTGPWLGLSRSRDGGDTWADIGQPIGDLPVSCLAISPEDPQVLYAGVALATDGLGRVFKSLDGGASWSMTGLELSWGWVNHLAFDPLSPSTLYAGTDEGLFVSHDAGDTWQRASGALGDIGIWGLAATSLDERSIFYLGALGGFPSARAAAGSLGLEPPQGNFVSAGVYQKTIARRWIYIPLVQSR